MMQLAIYSFSSQLIERYEIRHARPLIPPLSQGQGAGAHQVGSTLPLTTLSQSCLEIKSNTYKAVRSRGSGTAVASSALHISHKLQAQTMGGRYMNYVSLLTYLPAVGRRDSYESTVAGDDHLQKK